MMRPLITAFIAFFFVSSLSAQVIAPPDTFLCVAGPLNLQATYFGGGGTDSYVDSIIPYDFTTFTGNIYSGPDDQHSPAFSIPFDFCFYGNSYNQVVISTNNYITFDLSNASAYSPWTTQAIPDPNEPLNAIMGPWTDIDPNVGGTIRYGTVGTAPNRIFIVSYENVPMFSCNNLLYTGQIKIFEGSNIIETHVGNLPLCSSWNSGHSVHGLHNSTGTIAYTVAGRNNTSVTFSNEGRRFIPSGQGAVSWFDVNGTFLGSGTSLNVNPTQTTTYIVSASCGQSLNPAVTDTVTVSIGSVGLNFAVTDEDCWESNNGSAQVILPNSNSWDVSWSDINGNVLQSSSAVTGSDQLNGLEAGAYFVSLTDLTSGCTVIDTVYVNEPPPILGNAQLQDSYCDQNDGTIAVDLNDGFGALSWSWSDGDTALDRTGLAPGTYTLIITDANGCDTSQTFTINNINPIQASFTASPQSGSAPLSVSFNYTGTPGFTYSWDFGDGGSSIEENPTHLYEEDGDFNATLIVTDDSTGCVDTVVLRIEIDGDPRLTMPNVFTPDGFYPYFNAITQNDSTTNLIAFQADVYNRWGRLIYSWTDWTNSASGWDGTINGSPAPEGTYYYVAVGRGALGEILERTGFFMLIRND